MTIMDDIMDDNTVTYHTIDDAREDTVFSAVINLFRALVIYHQYRNRTDERPSRADLVEMACTWIRNCASDEETLEFYEGWVECDEPLPTVLREH